MKFTDVTRQGRKLLKLKYCGAVIVAAGTASRMGGIDKVMAELDGEPMILRTVQTFQASDAIKEIVDCGTFEPAVRAAAAGAEAGDVVLMSPASASFDEFKNFAVRGNFFKKLIMEL